MGFKYRTDRSYSRRQGGYVNSKEENFLFEKKLKDKFYTEIFFLSHIYIEKEQEAKELFENSIKPKKKITDKLDRNFSIEVDTLDYLKNKIYSF